MAVAGILPIVQIYEHTMHTFDKKFKSDMPANLNILKNLLDNLKADDLGFDDRFNDPEYWDIPLKSPCTYIKVMKNNAVSMSIFALKAGFKIPLHDHPHMHGFLKVISGRVRIKSFSDYPLRESSSIINYAELLKHEGGRSVESFYRRRRIYAQISQNNICTPNSETCILTPTTSNYHEIEALNEPAAFFDILSPPYDNPQQASSSKSCRYYYVAHELSTAVVELKEEREPEWYFCDQSEYLGPIIPSLFR